MEIKILKIKGTWQDVKDSAMNTIGKETGKEPNSKWKRQIAIAEHSPIRQLFIKARFIDIPYWVAMHFRTHKIGIEHWVSTQRDDRVDINGILRSDLPQGVLVTYTFEANTQAIINISRKRLCNCASKETREAWIMFLNELKNEQPELFSVSVPDCIYRGHCYEFKSCGYHKTDDYKQRLQNYRSDIN